jgi:glycosyltransferase involved in cell wall biosynthesis
MVLLSILVPAHNEEAIIEKFIEDVCTYVSSKNIPYELIIVENGSTDRTTEIIEKCQKRHSELKLFNLSEPSYGKAMKLAIEKAQGKYSVFFNVDLWDTRFIDVCICDLLGFDLISASKVLPQTNDNRPLVRRAVTRCFNLFLKLLGLKGTDTHGIKVYKTTIIKELLPSCKTDSGIFDTELILRYQRKHNNFVELPIQVTEIRPTRFGVNRILGTPGDIYKLVRAIYTK